MKIKSALMYAGYILAFFISLYFFILLTLPEEQIAKYVIDKYIRPAGINITYKSATVSYAMDLVMNEAEIEISDIKQKISLESLTMGISISGYFFGNRPFVLKADGFGGRLKLAAGIKKERIFLSAEAEELDALKIDIFREKTGLNIKGLISFSADINYDKKESKNNNGKISIEIKDSEIKGGKIMGFEIPSINTGNLNGQIEMKDGKFKVSNFKSKGKDIEARLSGDGGFGSPPSRSNLNLSLRVKPSQAFIDREEKVKTVLFGIGNSLDKEGFYNFSIKGTLSNPSFSIEKK